MDGIARTPTADGASRLASRRLADLDGAVHGARAAAKARAAADPTDLEPGEYEVVLEPAAVSDVLLDLGEFGFNGKAVNEGTSFLAVGEAQFDTSGDDGRRPAERPGRRAPFDAEGTPAAAAAPGRAGGQPRRRRYDRRSAHEAGRPSHGALRRGQRGVRAAAVQPAAAELGRRRARNQAPRPRSRVPSPTPRRWTWSGACGAACWSPTTGTPAAWTRAGWS